ncbi:class B sortase [Clostridium thermarum]|uniref:class B sortase n=1 Tax=Clostridium thermarum TaxID=1716543 RepID=UPI00111F0534|nr:class B sortase [Clostridium thermarum]
MRRIKFSLKNSSIINKILFTISLCIFLLSSRVLIIRAIDNHKSKILNDELSKIYDKINSSAETSSNGQMSIPQDINIDFEFEDTASSQQDIDEADKTFALKVANKYALERRKLEEQAKIEEIKKQVSRLLEINSDIKGWIRIDNTPISYPIVQTSDNSFYLDHDVTKKESRHGTIFVDTANDISSPKKLSGQNIILYGHNMKDGSMFGSIIKFQEDDFFTINDAINLDIFPNSYKFKIFGVYIVHESFDYRNPQLGSQKDINNFLKSINSKSVQYREVTLTPEDTLLTISTCGYNFDGARIVVLAKMIK